MKKTVNKTSSSLIFSQTGMTMVEIMVALVISLVLIAGLIQIFVGNKTTYRSNSGLEQLQDNGRTAISFLNYDLRMAGYIGCARMPLPPSVNNPFVNVLKATTSTTALPSWLIFDSNFRPTTSIRGYDNGMTSSFPAEFNTLAIPKTDAIGVFRADATNEYTINTQINTKITLYNNNHNIQQGEYLIASDCTNAALFQMTNANPGNNINEVEYTTATTVSPGNCNPCSDRSPSNFPTFTPNVTPTVLMRFVANAYYIGTGQSGRRALFRQKLQSTTTGTPSMAPVSEELIEGVQDMQIQYGIDNSNPMIGQADQYVTSTTDWTRVVSVRINLLLESAEDNVLDKALPYTVNSDGTITFNGVVFSGFTPSSGHVSELDDRRLRQVFSATISVRNQLP